ncbi:MAG TPA: pilus assembly protein N-terminal domain-containing protein, partial [Stenomitos sp.]
MERRWFALLLTLFLMLPALPASAAAPDIVIRMGQTIVYTVPEGVERVVVGDGDVIDAKPLSGQNRDLLISAKKPGFTNFLVWPSPTKGPDGRTMQGPVRNYNIEVLTNRRPETVAVRVKVMEVSRADEGNVGVDWSDSVSWIEAPPNAPFRFGLPTRETLIEAKLNMLVQQRKAKILAQPTLLTLNGASASFLAGGELPIPLILQNSIGIEWKPFGVKLSVTPRVEGSDTIVLGVRPEVSRIDQLNAVKLPGVSVP